MTPSEGHGWISRKERVARSATGMPADHPELLTRRPGRAEWKQFAVWLAELWPNDEYTAVVADAWQRTTSKHRPEGWRRSP
jgi:hypothetical protein